MNLIEVKWIEFNEEKQYLSHTVVKKMSGFRTTLCISYFVTYKLTETLGCVVMNNWITSRNKLFENKQVADRKWIPLSQFFIHGQKYVNFIVDMNSSLSHFVNMSDFKFWRIYLLYFSPSDIWCPQGMIWGTLWDLFCCCCRCCCLVRL